ncbi:MAG: sulfotransferase family protein [Chitinophagales bacterium]
MKYVFLGGSGRSGTSFVQKLLILHSEIHGGPEFDFLPRFMQIFSQMKQPAQLQRQSFFYDETFLQQQWQEFIASFLENKIIGTKNVSYISEKTPDNIFAAQQLLDLMPKAKFVYIYRDGRDVLNSFMNVKKRYKAAKKSTKHLSFLKLCLKWNDCNRHYHALAKNPAYKDRVYAVKYEYLLENPQTALQDLMSFLALGVEKEQFNPSQYSMKDHQFSADNIWYTEDMYKQNFNTSNIGKWQKEMSLWHKIIGSIAMAPYLKHHAYEISNSYISLHKISKPLFEIAKKVLKPLLK